MTQLSQAQIAVLREFDFTRGAIFDPPECRCSQAEVNELSETLLEDGFMETLNDGEYAGCWSTTDKGREQYANWKGQARFISTSDVEQAQFAFTTLQ